MAALYLVRHGQASFGADDYDSLSELGCRQATLLGQQLKALGVTDAIAVMGDMLRHRQTFEYANQAGCFAEQHINANWNEYDHQGILAAFNERMRTPTEIKQFLASEANAKAAFAQAFSGAIKKWQTATEKTEMSPYQETWSHFRDRVELALSEGLQMLAGSRHDGRDIVVFSSGGPISWCLRQLLNVPEEDWLALNWTLVNAGYHKIIQSSFGTFVSTMNEHSYLQATDAKLISYK